MLSCKISLSFVIYYWYMESSFKTENFKVIATIVSVVSILGFLIGLVGLCVVFLLQFLLWCGDGPTCPTNNTALYLIPLNLLLLLVFNILMWIFLEKKRLNLMRIFLFISTLSVLPVFVYSIYFFLLIR